jgi:Predicted membrane protein
MDTTAPPTSVLGPATTYTLRAAVRQTTADVAAAVRRLDSVDLFRGLIMVIMLIDHTRDYVHRDGLSGDPLNLATTTPLLYFTRWITHLCAPGFVLLAGASAGFQRHRGTPIPALSRFLWTRGLSLILMELTIIRLIGSFNVDPKYLANLQVIWAIGVSMVVLAALVHLPQRAVLAIGVVIVCGHNLLDSVKVAAWTSPSLPEPSALGKLWIVLHQGGLFPLFGFPVPIVRANYPVLPWIGVLALGYVFADLWLLPAEQRRRILRRAGLAMIVAFVVLRVPNLYGDPLLWRPQDTLVKTVGSFMNVQKYPPSLLYLLATLAPCMLALSYLEGRTFTNRLARALITYGRVPMFFYLLQWLWAHACGLTVSALSGMPLAVHFQSRAETFLGTRAPVFGGTLLDVYICWLLGAIVLYFPCRWYAGVKARRKDLVVLRYL